MMKMYSVHRIGIVIFEHCQIVDATGSAGVFGAANETLTNMPGPKNEYEICFISQNAGPVRTSAGVAIHADHALGELNLGFDTLICAGGKGTFAFCEDEKAISDVKRLAESAARVVSVCTGAFVLARAGLLDGHRAVTHWAHCNRIAEMYPAVHIDPDPIFIRDGNVFTSAGVTAGMDLALALVELDHGREIALSVARDMVMFMKRPGSQAQFSTHLAAQTAGSGTIRDLQLWLLDHLDQDIRIETLADKAAMSPRSLHRHFKDVTGMTPARFITTCRLESARRLIEESPLPLKSIASRCGFSDAEQMRRSFQRHIGISPDDYRRRFAA